MDAIVNIFYVHKDPVIAAQSLCDKHVVKMILESAQLMSTALRIIEPQTTPLFDITGVYKITHKNHPSAKWVRESVANYRWLHTHFYSLIKEYNYRYDKDHACLKLVMPLLNAPAGIPDLEFAEPPQCMPEEYKVPGNSVQAYRNYYIGGKKNIATWNKKRPAPEWYQIT